MRKLGSRVEETRVTIDELFEKAEGAANGIGQPDVKAAAFSKLIELRLTEKGLDQFSVE